MCSTVFNALYHDINILPHNNEVLVFKLGLSLIRNIYQSIIDKINTDTLLPFNSANRIQNE